MALTLLQEVPVVKNGDQDQRERDGFCPFCACRLNPGEKVCLDCLLDICVEKTD
jgi:hypothetical protein